MHIGSRGEQSGQQYSIDRAMHEARYMYGVVMATLAVESALDTAETNHGQTIERFKLVMGTDRFGKYTISELQQHLALTQIDQLSETQLVAALAYQKQLKILGKMATKREEQAALDWNQDRDIGFDVLLEDTLHLLPIPGEAANIQFGVDYLGESHGPVRSEADIPLMQHILSTDPT